MNEHAVPTDAGGYIFAFSISRVWVRAAVLCAAAAATVIAVIAAAAVPFRGPLAIALGVLATTMLITYILSRSTRRKPASTHGRRVSVARLRRTENLAAELALLAELRQKGALSDEEFTTAKRRILGS